MVDSPVHMGVQRFAKEYSWQLLIADPAEKPIVWKGDGVIMAEETSAVPAEGVAAVCLCRNTRGFPCATTDDEKLGALAARHYLERNFRHFAYYSRRATLSMRLREEGFRKACEGAGTYIVLPSAGDAAAIDAPAAARALAKAILAAPKPLGVFCGSDSEAMPVIDVCKIHGIALPDDVSILGVGNHISICEYECVPLSSVLVDYEQSGYMAAELLMRQMKRRALTSPDVLLPPVGVVDRQSTDILGTDNPALRRALKLIHDSLNRPIGAAQIAATLRCDRNRLDRMFAAELGRSAGQEILRQRLALVKTLLSDGKRNLEDVAAAAGFCNSSYLIKCFREATGKTPLDWRRLHARP